MVASPSRHLLPRPPQGIGASDDLLQELAEFDFTELAETVPLEHFHYSQRRAIFEIGWQEGGASLELRVHLVPMEIDDGGLPMADE